MIRKLFGLFVLLALLGAQTVSAEVKEINFGIISTEASMNLKKDWEPFLAEMEKASWGKHVMRCLVIEVLPAPEGAVITMIFLVDSDIVNCEYVEFVLLLHSVSGR